MTSNPRPLIPVNPSGLDDIAASLLGSTTTSTSRPTHSPSFGNYVILEAPKGKGYTYPDLLVNSTRLQYDPASMQRVARELSLNLENSGTGLSGHRYVGDINWEQALRLNLKLGNITLTPRQHSDFRELLQDGIDGKRKVYYGSGNAVDKSTLTAMFDEIAKLSDPWRSEWLDARFVNKSGNLHIEYGHRLQGNNLVPAFSEPLEAHVDSEGWVDIDSLNKQGLATKKARAHKLYFWPPSDGKVAGFYAGSGGAGLDCDGGATNVDSRLGVLACAAGVAPKK